MQIILNIKQDFSVKEMSVNFFCFPLCHFVFGADGCHNKRILQTEKDRLSYRKLSDAMCHNKDAFCVTLSNSVGKDSPRRRSKNKDRLQ